jgi:hypothetical protein
MKSACGVDESRDLVCARNPSGSDCAPTATPAKLTLRAQRFATFYKSREAEFAYDDALTRDFRARLEIPGDATACCYAHCQAMPVRATGRDAQVLGGGSMIPEQHTECFEAPGSTSVPAASPFEDCPAAVGFEAWMQSATPDVALDVEATKRQRTAPAKRIGDMQHACCYTGVTYHPHPRGRLLRIDGEARIAETRTTDAWLAAIADVDVPRADAERAALAARWERDAALEHASIAAFAKIAVALMALGAPPELVEGAHASALDEIAHARIAYALASRFAGEPRGPSALDVGALGTATLADVAVETLVDGCFGELLAAIAMREEARTTTDATLATLLTHIADDEERHAELAWKTLAWAVHTGGAELHARVDAALASITPSDALSAMTLRDVVVPCVRALLDAP